MFQSILSLLGGALLLSPVAYGSLPPVAKTLNGSYFGQYLPEFHQEIFRGVRFANAPRLNNPESLNETWKGTRSAEHNGHGCWVPWLNPSSGIDMSPHYKRANVTIDEDCLNLNILRPAGYEGKKLPVVVYIYGGGWIGGLGADLNTNSSYMLQSSVKRRAPYIVVNLNYRVGFLGFPGGSEAWSQGITNLGLKDQRMALRWVHENIAGFGGDPNKVTLWGQSAGSISIAHQILAYDGQGADELFRGGIMVSGGPYSSNTLYPNNSGSTALYEETLKYTGCEGKKNSLECLRQAPVEAVSMAAINAPPLAIWPMIDGDFITGPPVEQLNKKRFSRKIRLIVGANSDEGLLTANGFNPATETETEVAGLLRGIFPNARQSLLDKILEAYSADSPSPPYSLQMDFPFCKAMHEAKLICGAQYRRIAAILGDWFQIGPRRTFAEQWVAGGGTVYSYRFDTDPTALPIVENALKPGFSTHSTEIAYFFDLPSDYDMLNMNPTVVDLDSHHRLAKGITAGISSFISTGDPNKFKVPYFPKWPAYSRQRPVNMVYNATQVDDRLNVHIEPDTWRKVGMSLWGRHSMELQYLSPYRGDIVNSD